MVHVLPSTWCFAQVVSILWRLCWLPLGFYRHLNVLVLSDKTCYSLSMDTFRIASTAGFSLSETSFPGEMLVMLHTGKWGRKAQRHCFSVMAMVLWNAFPRGKIDSSGNNFWKLVKLNSSGKPGATCNTVRVMRCDFFFKKKWTGYLFYFIIVKCQLWNYAKNPEMW